MAIKNEQKGICWIDWPEELKDRHSKAVKEAEKELAEEVRSSMLGRKKKTTKKDTDDDIEFIDL